VEATVTLVDQWQPVEPSSTSRFPPASAKNAGAGLLVLNAVTTANGARPGVPGRDPHTEEASHPG